MIHRVAQHLRHCFGECLKFFPVGSVACDEFFVDAVRAHHAPFVMVAAEPNLGDVLPTFVLANLGGVEVAVEVDKRLLFGVFVIQFPSEFRIEKKVVVYEFFH